MDIGKKDKNQRPIKIGDKVRFKFYGQHYFTDTVTKCEEGYRPFAPLPVEVGFGGVNPKDCEVL
jgi:hypothetical protein